MIGPEAVFDAHTLNSCVEGGDICNGCLEPWPCDAYLITCVMCERLEESSKIIADLVAQRDACLDEMNRR